MANIILRVSHSLKILNIVFFQEVVVERGPQRRLFLRIGKGAEIKCGKRTTPGVISHSGS
jgi:hypothetical protein